MGRNSAQTPTPLSIAMEQMGRGWVKKLMIKTNFKRTYLIEAVKNQRVDAPIWDKVDELKKEHQAFLKRNAKRMKKALPVTTQSA